MVSARGFDPRYDCSTQSRAAILGVSSIGRVSGSDPEGLRFETLTPSQLQSMTILQQKTENVKIIGTYKLRVKQRRNLYHDLVHK